jgi:hypothetical protein
MIFVADIGGCGVDICTTSLEQHGTCREQGQYFSAARSPPNSCARGWGKHGPTPKNRRSRAGGNPY